MGEVHSFNSCSIEYIPVRSISASEWNKATYLTQPHHSISEPESNSLSTSSTEGRCGCLEAPAFANMVVIFAEAVVFVRMAVFVAAAVVFAED